VHAPPNNLAQHLAHETRLMQAFIALLDEEAQILCAPDCGARLPATTARKHAYADQLQVSAQARAAQLAALGFANVGEDLSPVVRQYPGLRPAIDALIALAGEASARNQANGVAIQTWQRHHQHALAALQAFNGGGNHLYDARGRSKFRVPSRPL